MVIAFSESGFTCISVVCKLYLLSNIKNYCMFQCDVIKLVIVCSHSASNLPGAVSHQNENESVSIEVGDGIAVKVEPDKPSPAHSDHSKNGRVSTLLYLCCA